MRPTQSDIEDIVAAAPSRLSSRVRDEMAIPSHTHWNPLIRWLMWRRYESILAMAPPSPRVSLEFGCGIGLGLPALSALSERVVAIDLFPELAMEMAERQGLSIDFAQDLTGLLPSSVDLIVAADVLEHLENPSETIEEFRRILAPSGVLVVSGPTENRMYQFGRILAGFGDKGDYHLTEIRALRRIIEDCGFTVAHSRRLPFSWTPALFEVHSFVLDP